MRFRAPVSLSGRFHKFDDEIECTAENAESAEALSIFISALSAISAVIRNHTCETQYLGTVGRLGGDSINGADDIVDGFVVIRPTPVRHPTEAPVRRGPQAMPASTAEFRRCEFPVPKYPIHTDLHSRQAQRRAPEEPCEAGRLEGREGFPCPSRRASRSSGTRETGAILNANWYEPCRAAQGPDCVPRKGRGRPPREGASGLLVTAKRSPDGF